jgi:hypothetical protein
MTGDELHDQPISDDPPPSAEEMAWMQERLREERARKAEAERLAAAQAALQEKRNVQWALCFDELEAFRGADADDDDEEIDKEDWRLIAQQFIDHALAYGWTEDVELAAFIEGLLRATGFTDRKIRGHGWVWINPR